MNLAERLKATNNRPSGFDYLRIALAVAVAIVHFRYTTYGFGPIGINGNALIDGNALTAPPVRALTAPILPMFFALSGFLVAGSLERSKTMLTFLGLRVIRIYPALAVEIVLSAFLIGPFVTSLPLASYFRDSLFWTYLLNVIGDVHFALPGVFENNPDSNRVNAQLWTVPYELLCYVTLAGLVLCGAVKRKILIPVAAVGLALAHLALSSHEYDLQLPIIGNIKLQAPQGPLGMFDGPLLIVCFLAGVSLYLFKDTISWSYPMFFSALMGSIALLWFVPSGKYPAILTITYMTVYLGLTNIKSLFLMKGADYSYGVYIYHYVIAQLFVYLAAPRSGWITLLTCIPLTTLVAAFSWHLIEKPAQQLRKPLAVTERHYLTVRDRLLNIDRA
jgi:peptidoglycan/LPS O-acetylase OafA/YrhL